MKSKEGNYKKKKKTERGHKKVKTEGNSGLVFN